MKKITIATIAALTLGAAQAAYTIKIPLENEVKYYQWSETEPTLGEWTNNGNIYDCSNWSPSSSSITIGESFTQTATDCKQDQIRNVQNREIDRVSGAIRDSGETYTESRTISVSDTRDAIGSLENWTATTPIYTDWVNSGEIYGCTNWSPDENTYEPTDIVNQSTNDCKQDQTRLRQDMEQETTTLAIRNSGDVITETRQINVYAARSINGTLILPENCIFSRRKEAWDNTIYYVFKNHMSADVNFIWAGTMWAENGKDETIFGGVNYYAGPFVVAEGGWNMYSICREPLD